MWFLCNRQHSFFVNTCSCKAVIGKTIFPARILDAILLVSCEWVLQYWFRGNCCCLKQIPCCGAGKAQWGGETCRPSEYRLWTFAWFLGCLWLDRPTAAQHVSIIRWDARLNWLQTLLPNISGSYYTAGCKIFCPSFHDSLVLHWNGWTYHRRSFATK